MICNVGQLYLHRVFEKDFMIIPVLAHNIQIFRYMNITTERLIFLTTTHAGARPLGW